MSCRRWWAVAALASLVAMVAAMSGLGRFLERPAQPPRTADLAVALGGDVGPRVERVVQLYRAGQVPRVLLTGLEGSGGDARRSYQNWRAQILIEHGVPREAILFDETSRNSWEEALNTRRLMEQKGWLRVLVVSDPPHMRRLDWAWGKVFAGSGREFILVSSEPEWWDGSRWWRDEKTAQSVILESIKLFYYLGKY